MSSTDTDRDAAEADQIRTFVTHVSAVEDIHPHLRQITFAGGDLTTFEPLGPDTFCYLLLPAPGRDTLGIDQSFTWEQYSSGCRPEERPVGAYYTVRRWRPDAAELDMLFVLHGDDGHASRWAARAKRGDEVALWGPRTAYHPPARHGPTAAGRRRDRPTSGRRDPRTTPRRNASSRVRRGRGPVRTARTADVVDDRDHLVVSQRRGAGHDDASGRRRSRSCLVHGAAIRVGRWRIAGDDLDPRLRPQRDRSRAGVGLARRLLATRRRVRTLGRDARLVRASAETVGVAQDEHPGQRSRHEHEHERGEPGFGEEPALERAPDRAWPGSRPRSARAGGSRGAPSPSTGTRDPLPQGAPGASTEDPP